MKMHILEDLNHWGLNLENIKNSVEQNSKGAEGYWEEENRFPNTAHQNSISQEKVVNSSLE